MPTANKLLRLYHVPRLQRATGEARISAVRTDRRLHQVATIDDADLRPGPRPRAKRQAEAEGRRNGTKEWHRGMGARTRKKKNRQEQKKGEKT